MIGPMLAAALAITAATAPAPPPPVPPAVPRLDLRAAIVQPAALQPTPELAVNPRDPVWTHIALAAYGIGQATDLSTSMYLFGAGRAHEANPLLSWAEDRPVAMGIAKGALAAGVITVLMKNHKSHPIPVLLTSIGLAAVQAWVTHHNYQFVPKP
jgi:hypothetical protein